MSKSTQLALQSITTCSEICWELSMTLFPGIEIFSSRGSCMLFSSPIHRASRSHSLVTFPSRVDSLTGYGADFETLRLTVIIIASVLSLMVPRRPIPTLFSLLLNQNLPPPSSFPPPGNTKGNRSLLGHQYHDRILISLLELSSSKVPSGGLLYNRILGRHT